MPPEEKHEIRGWALIKDYSSKDISLQNALVDSLVKTISNVCSPSTVYYYDGKGLDARLITPEIAEILGKLKWIKFIRMAADTDEMLQVVLKKIELLKQYGIKPYRIFVYVLVQDIESAERRVIALREVGANPFAQPYRDFENNIEPPKKQREFARWVNDNAIFKTVKTFLQYKAQKGK